MNKNDDTTHMPQSLTTEALNRLEKNSLANNHNEPQQMETYANLLTTNIIKDASKTANENLDNTNELHFLQTSKQTPTDNTITTSENSDHSTTNNDFDYEDIQKKMNSVIHDIQSKSGDETNNPPKSTIKPDYLHNKQIINSTPTIDPSIQTETISNNLNEGPMRSLSESNLVDHHVLTEQLLPIQQNETSSNSDDLNGIQSAPMNISSHVDQHQSKQENYINNPLDDDQEVFSRKTGTTDDNQISSNVIKQNGLDETTRFHTTSLSRTLSTTHMSPNELSTINDEKSTQIYPSKSFDDIDHDNQEIANISQSPSELNRPRSPLPHESRQSSTHSHINDKNLTNSSDNNQEDEESQKQLFQSSTEIVLPASQRESIDKNDDQLDRSSSTTDEQVIGIKKLPIPTNDFDNERLNSPPPSTGIKSMVLCNPLLGSHFNGKEQNQSRPSSGTNSTTSTISNEKILDGDILLTHNRKESNISQSPLHIIDKKSISRQGSEIIERRSHISNSSRADPVPQQDELNSSREQQPASGRASKASQESTSYRESFASEQPMFNRKENDTDQQKLSSRQGSASSQQQVPSKRESFTLEQQASSKRDSINDEQKIVSRKNSTHSEQQGSSRRQSVSDQQEQNLLSQTMNRKTSPVEQQQISNRRENEQPTPSSIRTSTNRDDQSSSSHRSSIDKIPSSHKSSRRNTSIKHEQQSLPMLVNNEHRRSSSETITNNHPPIKHEPNSRDKEIRTSIKHRSTLQRRSEQQSKRNSPSNTDETTVIPIIIGSSKTRKHNDKHISTTDSDFEHKSTSKLPSVNSSFRQEKSHHSETLNQQLPISNRSETKYISSSHATTPSEDEQPTHWTKHTLIPPIHFSDDETPTSQNKQLQKIEQKVEHNQTTKKAKYYRKEQHRSSPRSLSANSSTHIPLVDDKSVDSTSENNTEFTRHNQRNLKSKNKDVQTNTDQTVHSQQQDTSSDEQEITRQKPLKATKSMSDHLHSTHQHTPTKKHLSTTPDRTTPSIRYSVKQSGGAKQNKDRVVKNATDDESSHKATAETFVEQNSQEYFEPVQSSTKKNKEKSIEHHDRHTQSDTEQIITEKQKTNRRPKRISRTSQTYECVFRRMEREQYQELRATTATEKNIQTRKSQLRPRKILPKKCLSPYVSADAARIEEILRKQYYQSRRNLSKSSSLARSISPQGGKLLILRPTLPFHHTDAVNVQRVCLQYAIDLIPNHTTSTHRHKSAGIKQFEEIKKLPTSNISANKTGEHKHQRKDNGTI